MEPGRAGEEVKKQPQKVLLMFADAHDKRYKKAKLLFSTEQILTMEMNQWECRREPAVHIRRPQAAGFTMKYQVSITCM